jgi:predicted MFS family arabinose efflux permease
MTPSPDPSDPLTPRDDSAESLLYDSERAWAAAQPTVRVLMAALFYQGFAGSIVAIATPWIARSFHLDESAIARVLAWLAISSFGSLALARMADRAGRRRILIWSMGAMPACALGAALSTNLAPFIMFEIALNAFIGAAAAVSIVMLAEALPIARRATGQSMAGFAAAMGSAVTILAMPALAAYGLSWRWMLGAAACAIVFLPRIASAIPESGRWKLAAQEGEAARTRFYDVFVALYRKRSVTMIFCALLGAIVGEGMSSWAYFHAVSVVGLSAGSASAMMILGGGLGLLGFPAGAWSSETFGRVPTVAGSGVAVAAGVLFFFWGPPAGYAHAFLWLCGSFLFLNFVSNAATVAMNASATELFPTALRGTMLGWFALISAIGSLSAEGTISILARRLGGASAVVGWLAMLAVPSSLLFGFLIDETRGLSLEAAANEDAFRDLRG